jgi:hypothetical protein
MKLITITAPMAFLLSGATGYAQQQLPGSPAARQWVGDPMIQEPTYDQLRRSPELARRYRGPTNGELGGGAGSQQDAGGGGGGSEGHGAK